MSPLLNSGLVRSDGCVQILQSFEHVEDELVQNDPGREAFADPGRQQAQRAQPHWPLGSTASHRSISSPWTETFMIHSSRRRPVMVLWTWSMEKAEAAVADPDVHGEAQSRKPRVSMWREKE